MQQLVSEHNFAQLYFILYTSWHQWNEAVSGNLTEIERNIKVMILFQAPRDTFRGTCVFSRVSGAHQAHLPASTPPSPPRNIRFVTPVADLTGLTQGYSDTSFWPLIGQSWSWRILIGHWARDVSRHASLRDDSGPASPASLASGHSELRLNCESDKLERVEIWRTAGETIYKYSVELLLQPPFHHSFIF